MKKYIFLISAAAFWWLLFFRFGDSPRFCKIFLFSESPLQIHSEKLIDREFSNQRKGRIEFDEFGIPEITANSENDAAYFLGWMHGQERRFQMEMIRRTVQGQLSEIVGQKAISSDVFWRRFQFSKKVRTWYTQQPKELKMYFEAYAEGINDQWKQQKKSETPLEFFLLDFEPQVFQPHDLFFLLRYMDFALNYDEASLAKLETQQKLPKNVFELFYPNQYSIEHPILSKPISIENETGNNMQPNFAECFYQIPQKNWVKPSGQTETGSNNWAVGKSKLLDANAALSNDPHLKLQLPNTWYEANIVTPKGKKSGFTLPGSPFIISGNNDSIAWGITNATWSLTHFFPVKKISHNKFEFHQEEISIKKSIEHIDIRGGQPLKIEINSCPYGIIDTIQGKNYLIQWVGNAPIVESNEAQTFWGLEHSHQIREAIKSLEYYGHPPQNFVIADHRGNIYQATCGFIGESQPKHPVTWKKGQHILNENNPDRGFVFSANQPQTSHPSVFLLSNSFAPEARSKGIKKVLNDSRLSNQAILALQTNVEDEEWEDFKYKFISFIPKDYFELKKEMMQWNGEMREESISASFFSIVRYFLQNEIIKKCLGNVAFLPHSDRINELLLNHETVHGIRGDIAISKIWNQGMILGIDSLVRTQGKNWRNWTYGKIHRTEITHITKIPALGGGFWSLNGSSRSVNVLRLGKGIHGASMRNTVFFTDSGFIRYSINFGGQSGRCFSPHYMDQLQPWKSGWYHFQNHVPLKPSYVYEFHP